MNRLYLAKELAAQLTETPGFRVLHAYQDMSLVELAEVPERLAGKTYMQIDTAHVVVNGRRIIISDSDLVFSDTPRHVIRFIGPVASDWLVTLNHNQLKIWFMCPPYGACVEIPESLKSDDFLKKFPFIAGLLPYQEPQCTRAIEKPSDHLRHLTGLPDNIVDLVCFSREDRYRIETQLAQQGTRVLSSSSSKIRIQYTGDPRELRDLNGVKIVDHVRASLLAHVTLPDAVGAVDPATSQLSLTGVGQVIAVADTGLDTGVNDESLHEDLRGRVRQIISWPMNDAWSSFVNNPRNDDGGADRGSGHGTHVSGLALGSGSKSQGKFMGVAPQAQLVFQAIEQYTNIKSEYQSELASGYYLSGKPMDLRKLFMQAQELGAKIHVNAWGDPAQGQYTDDSYEADMFLHENPDNVVLFASGNTGADLNGDRLLDASTLYSPASAKNVIAIGATEGSNLGVGLRANWSAFDQTGSRFANLADRNDPVSGDAEQIALFSSCGPTLDGRIKPDVCAPGTNLAAPRSSLTQEKAWGLASPLPFYMYNGGTSMAVGVAGGAVALLREAWQKFQNGRAPSGVALKALTVFGVMPVINRATGAAEPRNIAGFGRIHVNSSIPFDSHSHIKLQDEIGNGMFTGEVRELVIHHQGSSGFRAVLAWYDPPGEQLINDLDLCLRDAKNSPVWGNHLPGEGGEADRVNNLEVIDLPDLPAGQYRLQVIAHNLPVAPQDYALVMTAGESLPLINIPVEYLMGIGATYRKRLAQNKIVAIAELSELSRQQIKAITKMNANAIEAVLARCAVIKQISRTIAANVSENIQSMNLHQLLFGMRPISMPEMEWQKAKTELISLLLVFNKAALKKVQISNLY